MSAPPDGNAPFDAWAPYYDLTDADRAPYIAFYGSLISPATRSLLELGCGTGRITTELRRLMASHHSSSRELRVAGVDESIEMLRVARAREPAIHWLKGDMRSPPVQGRFDLVICCFNTLQFLLEDDHLLETFRSVRALLSPGGTFAFDLYQPNIEYVSIPQTNRLARSLVDGEGRQLEIREDTRYHAPTKTLTIHWRLVATGTGNGETLAQTMYRLRQYFADDVVRSLARADLLMKARYGDLAMSPFTTHSKKQVVVCTAPS